MQRGLIYATLMIILLSDLPGTVFLQTGSAVGLFCLTTDSNLLLELTALQSRGTGTRPGRYYMPRCVTGIPYYFFSDRYRCCLHLGGFMLSLRLFV